MFAESPQAKHDRIIRDAKLTATLRFQHVHVGVAATRAPADGRDSRYIPGERYHHRRPWQHHDHDRD